MGENKGDESYLLAAAIGALVLILTSNYIDELIMGFF